VDDVADRYNDRLRKIGGLEIFAWIS